MSSGKAKKTESTQGSVLKSKAKISSQIDPQGASQLTEVDREKFLMENTELYTSQKIKLDEEIDKLNGNISKFNKVMVTHKDYTERLTGISQKQRHHKYENIVYLDEKKNPINLNKEIILYKENLDELEKTKLSVFSNDKEGKEHISKYINKEKLSVPAKLTVDSLIELEKNLQKNRINTDKKENTFNAPKFSTIRPPTKGPIRGPKAIIIEIYPNITVASFAE